MDGRMYVMPIAVCHVCGCEQPALSGVEQDEQVSVVLTEVDLHYRLVYFTFAPCACATYMYVH